MNSSAPEPTSLQLVLKAYQTALDDLDNSQIPLTQEQALNILVTRDILQKELENQCQIPVERWSDLIKQDIRLKQQAYKITQIIDLSDYRDTLAVASQGWWWHLDSRESLHPWNRFDWLLRAVRFVFLTVNFSLIGTIAIRFLSGGSGLLEIAALIFPTTVSLFEAQNALTDAKEKGFSKLMQKCNISQCLYEKIQLLITVIITYLLLWIWANFPLFSEFYNQEGKKYQDNQQLAQAEQSYLKAIELNPDNLDAHFKLATLYEELQDFDSAKKLYLIAAKGGFIDAYNNLAYWYLRENKDGEAVELLEKGQSLLAQKDNQFDQLSEDEKRNLAVQKYSIYKNLGWARFKQNRYEDAIPNLLVAMGIAKDYDQYIRNAGAAYCIYAQILQKQDEESSQTKPYWQECLRSAGQNLNTEEDKWLYEAKKQLP